MIIFVAVASTPVPNWMRASVLADEQLPSSCPHQTTSLQSKVISSSICKGMFHLDLFQSKTSFSIKTTEAGDPLPSLLPHR